VSTGSPLLVISRSARLTASSYLAIDHDTSPCTLTFWVASQVPAASSIHGPTAKAPPPLGLPESHTHRLPTAYSVVETCGVPIGSRSDPRVDDAGATLSGRRRRVGDGRGRGRRVARLGRAAVPSRERRRHKHRGRDRRSWSARRCNRRDSRGPDPRPSPPGDTDERSLDQAGGCGRLGSATLVTCLGSGACRCP